MDLFSGFLRMKKATILMITLMFAGCGIMDSEKPNIVLIIIDTLRADHLGCYGYHRDTSPVLDSLADEGVRFSRCQAQAPWTLPAHATIWTGLTVVSHQARRTGSDIYGVDVNLPSIATILKAEGYVTLGFVNIFLLNGDFGFDNGFDHYSWFPVGDGRAEESVSEILQWFDDNRGNPSPKLVVLHLYDVHSPYDPPAPFDTLFSPEGTAGVTNWNEEEGAIYTLQERDHLLNLYDGEIAWVDSQLGRLFAGLRERGVTDNSLIIVTSDHGEEFLEHGRVAHGHTLYQELIHVPLIISGNGIPAGLIDSINSGQFDILPTIAGYAGVTIPEGVEGVDLFLPRDPDRSIPSSGLWPPKCFYDEIEGFETTACVLSGKMKGTVNFATGYEMMHDLQEDPLELSELPLDANLFRKIEAYWTTPPVADPQKVFDQVIEDNLEGLGYI